ncbi:MAG: hypothetical protein ACR2KT_16300, partial [Methylocella sp.]
PLARVTASNSLDERSAPIKPTPRRPKSPTVPPQANIFRGALEIEIWSQNNGKKSARPEWHDFHWDKVCGDQEQKLKPN